MKKIKSIFIAAIVISYALGGAFLSRQAASGAEDGQDELMQKVTASRKPTCERVKNRIMAALELFTAENTGFSPGEISVPYLVERGYLRFEPVCPTGGKYTLKVSGAKFVPLCDKCDGGGKKADSDVVRALEDVSRSAGGVHRSAWAKRAAKAGRKGDTLETQIDKYLGKDDMELLDADKKKTDDASAAKTSETAVSKAPSATDEDQITALADASKKAEGQAETSEAGQSGAEQIQPADVPLPGRGARDFHAEAIEHARRGEVDRALEKFQRAIELQPDSFTYHYNYALFQAKIENYDQAYVLFQRALRLNPGDRKVLEMIEKLKKAISSK